MSTMVMSACWPLQLPPTPKAVLISLADNANDHGLCWPSITTICTRTCFGRTAVIDAIKWLEEHGLIEADRDNGRHTKYWIKPNGFTPELFDATGKPRNQSGKRTSPPAEPVRKANQSGKRTGSEDGLDPSASRTEPVREADTNRQEPSGTGEIRAGATPPGTLAAGIQRALGPTCALTSIHPDVIAAAREGVTADMVIEAHAAHPEKSAAYALGVARGQLRDGKSGSKHRGGAPPGGGTSARDNFTSATYVGTPNDELPEALRT